MDSGGCGDVGVEQREEGRGDEEGEYRAAMANMESNKREETWRRLPCSGAGEFPARSDEGEGVSASGFCMLKL